MLIKAYRGYKPKYNNYEGVNMRRKLLFILAPVFALAVLITLASCGDAYGGNYQEVTGEQLTAVETKLNNCAEKESENQSSYELTISATIKTTVSGGNSEATINAKQIYDNSDENNSAFYSKYEMKITSTDGTINILSETWTLTDGTAYINASMTGKAAGTNYNISIKKKATSQSSYTALNNNEDYMAIQNMMASFASALSQYNSTIDLSEIAASLDSSNVKVYTAGDNKIKLELTNDNVTTSIYIIINSDNTFQMKLEAPETKIGGLLGGMTIKVTSEMKPTSAKVTAPSGNFEEI